MVWIIWQDLIVWFATKDDLSVTRAVYHQPQSSSKHRQTETDIDIDI